MNNHIRLPYFHLLFHVLLSSVLLCLVLLSPDLLSPVLLSPVLRSSVILLGLRGELGRLGRFRLSSFFSGELGRL